MNILGLVTAKSHSGRVPYKNFQFIAGKQLFRWTTDFLSENQDCFTALAFSSDEPDIFDVPHNIHKIQRPPNLCVEDVEHKDIMVHALDQIEYCLDKKMDYIVLFQPTNPFRIKSDLRKLIVMAEQHKPTHSFMYYVDDNLKGEQIRGCSSLGNLPPMIRSGNMYLYSREYLYGTTGEEKLVTLKIPKWRGYNINTKEDFYVAEALYEANNA